MGNVVGSNIYNVLLVLGLGALVAPLVVRQRIVRADVPLLIGVSLLFWVLAADGSIDRLDGLPLLSAAAGLHRRLHPHRATDVRRGASGVRG